MKKIYYLCLIFLILNLTSLNAQAFKKGDVIISPGIGLGTYGVGYGLGFAVPVVLNADFGVHDYVSVGAYTSFWTKKWNYAFNEKYRFTSTHFGVRASFHFWKLIDKHVDTDLLSDKLDIYFCPWLGYNLRTAKWISDGNLQNSNLGWGNRFQGGAQIGVRYYFNKNFGVFGEWGGTPSSWSNWGISIKF